VLKRVGEQLYIRLFRELPVEPVELEVSTVFRVIRHVDFGGRSFHSGDASISKRWAARAVRQSAS
jgi:hypothetical protein